MNDDLSLVWVLLFATATVCAVLSRRAWRRYKDPFHPALLLGAPCFAAYVLQPAALLMLYARETLQYLSPDQLEFITIVNCVCTLMLLGGTLQGSHTRAESGRGGGEIRPRPAISVRRLRIVAYVLGGLGVAAFVAGVIAVGGLDMAYGQGYGGGYSDSGYIRDAYWLCLPAVALLLCADGPRLRNAVPIAVFCCPFLIHGLLGARRGPTAALLLCLMVAYGLAVHWRPKLWQFATLLAAIGLLMLALVANRQSIHWGMESLYVDSGIDSYATRASEGNEFIYGGGTIIAANESGDFFWGGRYATVLLIRPVPRTIWPAKYDFAARFFGIPNLETAGANFGTGLTFSRYLGWVPPVGAAPGLIADLWLEFGWFSTLALFVIGFAYGRIWRSAITGDPFWGVAYSLIAAFAVYLVAQTLEAMLFRFAFTAGMTLLAWIAATGEFPRIRVRGAPERLRKASVRL